MKLIVSMAILAFSISAFGQKIIHRTTLENGSFQTILVAKEFTGREQVNTLHNLIKSMDGVEDVNFIYPESNKFVLTYREQFDVKEFVARLKENGVELTPESINLDI